MLDQLPYVPTPEAPLAPLNDAQERFLDLHRHHTVVRWQWAMQGALLRAWTDRGTVATVTRVEWDELEQAGLMRRGLGSADVHACN